MRCVRTFCPSGSVGARGATPPISVGATPETADQRAARGRGRAAVPITPARLRGPDPRVRPSHVWFQAGGCRNTVAHTFY